MNKLSYSFLSQLKRENCKTLANVVAKYGNSEAFEHKTIKEGEGMRETIAINRMEKRIIKNFYNKKKQILGHISKL